VARHVSAVEAEAREGTKVGLAASVALEQAGESLASLERAAFSHIASVRLQLEPFEKTATQKIKRFLYPRV